MMSLGQAEVGKHKLNGYHDAIMIIINKLCEISASRRDFCPRHDDHRDGVVDIQFVKPSCKCGAAEFCAAAASALCLLKISCLCFPNVLEDPNQ